MDLRFNGRIGRAPDPQSTEALFLAACCAEDRRVWRALCDHKAWEIREAIETLQRLGWGFEWVTVH